MLCGEPNPIACRNHALDLCEPCSPGYLTGRLGAFGAELTVEEVKVTDSRDGHERLDLHVIARMPIMLPVFAQFARLTLRVKLARIGGRGSAPPHGQRRLSRWHLIPEPHPHMLPW